MKIFIVILFFSSGFIPADFHPIDGLISSELTDLTGSPNEVSESLLEVIIVVSNNSSNFSLALN